MKKIKRLHLSQQTIRNLSASEQIRIRGGVPTETATDPSWQPWQCVTTSQGALCTVNVCVDTKQCTETFGTTHC